MNSKLSLIVLKTEYKERLKEFYEILGLQFTQEKHGDGPVHYSCEFDGLVLEIYPGKSSKSPMLGFNVDSIDAIVSAFEQKGVQVKKLVSQDSYAKKAAVYDPDGRTVFLSQIKS